MQCFVVARLASLGQRLLEYLHGFLLAFEYFFSQLFSCFHLFLVQSFELVKKLRPDLQIHRSFHIVRQLVNIHLLFFIFLFQFALLRDQLCLFLSIFLSSQFVNCSPSFCWGSLFQSGNPIIELTLLSRTLLGNIGIDLLFQIFVELLPLSLSLWCWIWVLVFKVS